MFSSTMNTTANSVELLGYTKTNTCLMRKTQDNHAAASLGLRTNTKLHAASLGHAAYLREKSRLHRFTLTTYALSFVYLLKNSPYILVCTISFFFFPLLFLRDFFFFIIVFTPTPGSISLFGQRQHYLHYTLLFLIFRLTISSA